MNTANLTAKSCGAEPPSTKQRAIGDDIHFNDFLYIRLHNAENRNNRGLPKKKVFIQGFTVSSGAQVMPFSLFSLGLLSSSFCIENGENNEKSNHMFRATSDIELEFLTNFLNVEIAKSVVPEGAVTNFRTFVIYSRNQMLGGLR